MIVEHIDNPSEINTLSNQTDVWQPALQWIRDAVQKKLPVGKYDIGSQSMYALIQEKQTELFFQRPFEAHEKHIDLQYCAAGKEAIYWAERASLKLTHPYSEAEDFMLFDPMCVEAKLIQMTPGKFAIFFPADAHKPLVNDGQSQIVKKIVVKIPLSLVS